jgi:hypothetical protein
MSNAVTVFETVPFNVDADLEEVGRRFTGGARSSSVARRGASRMPGSTQSRLQRGPHRPVRRYGLGAWMPPLEGGLAPPPGAVPSEQIRWVQFMLNSALGSNLPVDGLVSSDLCAALRDFQRQQGLPVSGFVGPDTIDALKQMSASEPSGELAGEEFEISDKMVRALDERLKQDKDKKHLTTDNLVNVPEVPGLYRITWDRSIYYGKSEVPKERIAWTRGSYYGRSLVNLRERLRDHINEVEQLGFSVKTTHMFTYAAMPRRDATDVKIAEKKVIALYIGKDGNTNKKIGELELSDF